MQYITVSHRWETVNGIGNLVQFVKAVAAVAAVAAAAAADVRRINRAKVDLVVVDVIST